MAAQARPKVLLFDIGGVCVVSPFQTILDYEISLGVPPGWINYSISRSAPNGFWQRLERGHIPMDAAFFEGFNKDLHDPSHWKAFYEAARARSLGTSAELPAQLPPLPAVDGELVFNEMMRASEKPDPWMYPALQRLHASGQYIVAALSNTVIFPPGHRLHKPNFREHPVKELFDVFVSSAHVGLRKPEPEIYDLAVREVDAYARANAGTERGKKLGWASGVAPQEIVFLDDIGENLKGGRKHGFHTVKVHLGRTYEAVDELEAITGLDLAGDHPRPPHASKQPPRARI